MCTASIEYPICSLPKHATYFESKGFVWGKRHTVILLGFFGTAIACSIQNNLSLAIVPMTEINPTAPQNNLHLSYNTNLGIIIINSSKSICPRDDPSNHDDWEDLLILHLEDNNNSTPPPNLNTPTFSWPEKDQGVILGSFFWGYILSQYPGGRWAHRFGGKWVFSLGIIFSGIFSILLPFATISFGSLGLISVRILQGLAQGVICPSIHVMIAHWSPPEERSRMTNLIYTGYPFGTAATLICGGYLIHSLGWPYIFYTTGALSILWFMAWALLVSNTPQDHPSISSSELHLIEESINEKNSLLHQHLHTPWSSILISLPVWSIFINQVGQFWGKNIIQIEVPKYLGAVHSLKIQHIGWIAALPQFLNCIFGLLTSSLSDWLIIKQLTSVEFTRKLCAMIVGCGTSAAFIGMAFAGCQTTLALGCLLLGGVVSGASRGSWVVNTIDIAPNHAGTILAVGSTVSYFMGMLTPYATGILLHLYPTLLGWQLVFWIGAAANFSTSLFYLKYAKCTEQGWNRAKAKNGQDNNNQC